MTRTRFAPRGLVEAQETLVMRFGFVAGTVVSIAIAAATAGVALALSSFYIPALHDVPAEDAVRAMQQLTAHEIPPAIRLGLVASSAYVIAPVLIDLLTRGRRACGWLAVGAGFYVVGVIGVTVFGNMPLNDWLHSVDHSAVTVDGWLGYATAWAGFNNVRIVAATVSCLLFGVAALRR